MPQYHRERRMSGTNPFLLFSNSPPFFFLPPPVFLLPLVRRFLLPSPSLAVIQSHGMRTSSQTGSSLVLKTTCTLATERERETTVAFHQAELQARRKKQKAKNEQHFPVLERSRPFACSLVFLLFSFLIALTSCTKSTLTRPTARAQHHRYEDGRMVSRVNHVYDEKKKESTAAWAKKKASILFPLSFNKQGALIFLFSCATKREKRRESIR